ncbi:MAG: hypothetical protein JNN20_04520 [Betaproteobacteria bacterium]|nr:hypothetical protein [Betaproteobacteria bacterium]
MSSTQQISRHQPSLATQSHAGESNHVRRLARTLTGVALIAILYGFAMNVMPHLSAAGKIAAVVLQAGIATSAFALICLPQRHTLLLDEIDLAARCDDHPKDD